MIADILVADDDQAIRQVIRRALERQGYKVTTTGSAAALWRLVMEGRGNIIITDVVMPDGNGLDLMPKLLAERPELKIIAMSAQTTLLTAVKATQRGAFDYLPKPFDLDDLIAKVEQALSAYEKEIGQSLKDNAQFSTTAKAIKPSYENDAGQNTVLTSPNKDELIGRSPAMQEVYRRIARLSTTGLSVLINGESGSGKELVARSLHAYSKRKDGPFIAVNMAAIPRELIESELFGHEKGAFTGASTRMIGHFERARGGALFLDEIGDMPLEAQTRLLRVLQDGSFHRIGGREVIQTDARIIAATHHDLRRLVENGQFREDLYYRLAVAPVHIPPLRARKSDIAALALFFLNQTKGGAQDMDNGEPKSLTKEALLALEQHNWPGNVRELMNMMMRLKALYTENPITLDIIEREFAESPHIQPMNGRQNPLHYQQRNQNVAGQQSYGIAGYAQSQGRQAGQASWATTPDYSSNNDVANQTHLIPDHIQGREDEIDHILKAKIGELLPQYFQDGPDYVPHNFYHHIMKLVEEPLFQLSLEANQGNRVKTAAMLGINRNTLRTHMENMKKK